MKPSRGTSQRNPASYGAVLLSKVTTTIVLVAIVYAVVQPLGDRWFGWQLPPIGSLIENPASNSNEIDDTSAIQREPQVSQPDRGSSNRENDLPSAAKRSKPQATPGDQTTSNNFEELLRVETPSGGRLLVDLGRNRYKTPAGLIYGPGSQEGHRLKHIAKHLEDQPNRPGKHGIFDGDLREFVLAIDEAYAAAQKGNRGSSIRQDGDTTIVEAELDRQFGHIGGREGRQRNHPVTNRMRVVLQDQAVITAFPF